jgi:transcriptional regulator with XRE-family HTH domain
MSRVHTSAVESPVPVMLKCGMAESAKSLAKRVEQTRIALEMSQADLCKVLKIKANRWSQYESGERRITLQVANKLCDEFGLSLDWIYRANPAQLPHSIRLKIRDVA